MDRAYAGDVEFFKNVALDVMQKSRDELGRSVLDAAVMGNHLDCCKEIFKRCPSLLYHREESGWPALVHAAHRGVPEIMEFLISANAKLNSENGDIESGGGGEIIGKQNLLTMVNNRGESALYVGVNNEKPVSVKMLVEADPDHELLRMANVDGVTALHLAVRKQNVEIVKLLIEADPDYEYRVDASGETPLSLAVLHEETGKIRKLLLEKQPSKLKIRTGNNGWTLLHHFTYKGHLGAIEDIIRFCPDCMEVVDNEGRNFLHLAAKYEHVKVVKQLLGTKEIGASILNRQDIEGNTPLHTAALSGNQNIVECFLYDHQVTKTTVNNHGQHVLDAINFDYDKAKAGVFGFTGRMNQKELKDQSDFDLVVGALIAAVSFTAGITVPGGYISEGPNQGMAVLSKVRSFQAFVVSNNFALMFSLYAVFSHFCTRSMHNKEDIGYQLKVATFCTLGAIFAMMVAFITGSYAVLADSDGLSITVCVQSCCFFIFALRAIWKMVPNRHPGVYKTLFRKQFQLRNQDSVIDI